MSLSVPTMSAIRFGYGIRPGEAIPNGVEDLMAQLAAGAAQKLSFPEEGVDGRYDTIATLQRRIAKLRKQNKETVMEKARPITRKMNRIGNVDLHNRIIHTVASQYGFYERLTAFWMDHFSVSMRKNRLLQLLTALYEVEAIRPHVSGSFADLLRQAILHPAMLLYLDQSRSFGPNSTAVLNAKRGRRGLNENLGRELLELHTLGVSGGYDQSDVRNAALVLTGLTMDRATGRLKFQEKIAEPGTVELFGKSYGGDQRSIEDVYSLLDDLAMMPKTREHICRKLAIHFISDDPDPALVESMVAAWTKSDGQLETVYRAMLDHPAAWSNPGLKARQPLDFIIAGLRAADIPADALQVPMRNGNADQDAEMQPPGGAASANEPMSNEMMAEEGENNKQAMDGDEAADKPKKRMRPPVNPLSIGALRKLGQPLWEPDSPAGSEEAFSVWISASQLSNRIAWSQQIANSLPEQTDPTSLLKSVLRDAARQDTITVVSQAPSRAAGIALVLASPEFNRR